MSQKYNIVIKKILWSKAVFLEVNLLHIGALGLFDSAPKGSEQLDCAEFIMLHVKRDMIMWGIFLDKNV